MNEALMSRPFLYFFLSFSLVDGMLKCKCFYVIKFLYFFCGRNSK